jgi:hypothetical protein
MVNTVRVLVGVVGGLLMVGGLVAAVVWSVPDGLWAAVTGAVVLVAVVLERTRYRSEAAERSAGQPGPGGGEHAMPAAPFRPTDEVFIDPTSGARLRVYLNSATGERRYYAEGARPGS